MNSSIIQNITIEKLNLTGEKAFQYIGKSYYFPPMLGVIIFMFIIVTMMAIALNTFKTETGQMGYWLMIVLGYFALIALTIFTIYNPVWITFIK